MYREGADSFVFIDPEGIHTFDGETMTNLITEAGLQQQMVEYINIAVNSPVEMLVQIIRHHESGNGVISEGPHKIESLSDALAVCLLALQSYGFNVETLAAMDEDDNGETVDSDYAEMFLNGATYIR